MWSYSKAGWTSVFQPVSKKCSIGDVENIEPYRTPEQAANLDINTIGLPLVDYIPVKPVFMARNVPHIWQSQLSALHGLPMVWWAISWFVSLLSFVKLKILKHRAIYLQGNHKTVDNSNKLDIFRWLGQFLKRIWRLEPELSNKLNYTLSEYLKAGPIVGVHIRRTDKIGTEAKLYTLDQYMEHVELWYMIQVQKL